MADIEGPYHEVQEDGGSSKSIVSRQHCKVTAAVIGSSCLFSSFIMFAYLCTFTHESANAAESTSLVSLQPFWGGSKLTKQTSPMLGGSSGYTTGRSGLKSTLRGDSKTAPLRAVPPSSGSSIPSQGLGLTLFHKKGLDMSTREGVRTQTLPEIEMLPQPLTRRGVFGTAAAAALASFAAKDANAAEEDNIEVYFGCGCFWHVQHEFVEAERKYLKRGDMELTALSGFAGGNGGMKDGKVCYDNAYGQSVYTDLGHAEVVRLKIPPSSFREFATEYVKLFDKDGNRPDQYGDRGLQYRNVVGIPGGKESPLAKELVEVSAANGDKLDFAIGKGSDPDAKGMSFIMDSTQHPFHQAEVYHQFHDGFKFDENYPDSYNRLAPQLFKAGRVVDQGCPNGMFGVGFGGL